MPSHCASACVPRRTVRLSPSPGRSLRTGSKPNSRARAATAGYCVTTATRSNTPAGTASNARRMSGLPSSSASSLFAPKRTAFPAAMMTQPSMVIPPVKWILESFAGAPVVRCRGGDSQARPRSGIRTAKSMPCTVPCARPLMCHCEEQSDVAISGRQLQPVQAIADRMQYCRGGACPSRHCTGGKCGLMLKRQWPPSLSLRGGQRPTWQSHATDHVFAWAFLISDMVLRDCHGPFGASQ